MKHQGTITNRIIQETPILRHANVWLDYHSYNNQTTEKKYAIFLSCHSGTQE